MKTRCEISGFLNWKIPRDTLMEIMFFMLYRNSSERFKVKRKWSERKFQMSVVPWKKYWEVFIKCNFYNANTKTGCFEIGFQDIFYMQFTF